MSLLEMQRAFSRILTDRTFRRAFLAGEQDAVREYRLTDRELNSLRGLPRDRVAQHAWILAGSRLELALKSIPLAATLLHQQLHRFVDRFCAEFPPVPVAAGQVSVESARLCAFILRLLDEQLLTPYWARDVVTFEHIRYSLGVDVAAWDSGVRTAARNQVPAPADDRALRSLVPETGPHARLADFDHDLVRIIPRLAAGEIPPAPPLNRPLHILFVRGPTDPAVRTIKVNDATVALLSACDGRRSVAGLLDRLAGSLSGDRPVDRASLDRPALAALRSLQDLNVIAFRSSD